MTTNETLPEDVLDHTFLLKVTDRPGAMELIAATFAHRGISLTDNLGNDGTLTPDGHAVVLLHFRATASRKETLKNTLKRLSRVLSVVEYAADHPILRRSALLRLAPGAPAPALPEGVGGTVEFLAGCEEGGECVYAVSGPAQAVEALLESARVAGVLRAVTQTVLAL